VETSEIKGGQSWTAAENRGRLRKIVRRLRKIVNSQKRGFSAAEVENFLLNQIKSTECQKSQALDCSDFLAFLDFLFV